jgi:tRNA modification GTPase
MLGDTIFALSSGAPPAAIAVVRISGPGAGPALAALAGRVPEARRATLAKLIEPSSGELLDNAIILFFPGPNSATGEDLAELHLHGGRSVVRAVTGSLAQQPGMREAQPGEFTRRAFENGRIDLAEAEGLADLLASETESQRRAALTLAEGKLSRLIEAWREDLLAVSAQVEAVLNFSDEGDVEEEVSLVDSPTLRALVGRIDALLAQPPAERLRDGVRVAIAGLPTQENQASSTTWPEGQWRSPHPNRHDEGSGGGAGGNRGSPLPADRHGRAPR